MEQLELFFIPELRKEEARKAEMISKAFRGKMVKKLKSLAKANNWFPAVPAGMTEIIPDLCVYCGAPNRNHWPGCPLGDPNTTMNMAREGLTQGNIEKSVLEVNLRALNCHLVRILKGPGTVQFPNGNKLLFDEDGNALCLDEKDYIQHAIQNPNTDGMKFPLGRLPNGTAIIEKGAGKIELPNGHRISLAADGEYVIVDANGNELFKTQKAFVIRSSFSSLERIDRYLLTSDSLEEFIREVGALGITQKELLDLPIESFINWLVIKAAKRDGEPIPDDIPSLEEDENILTILESKV